MWQFDSQDLLRVIFKAESVGRHGLPYCEIAFFPPPQTHIAPVPRVDHELQPAVLK